MERMWLAWEEKTDEQRHVSEGEGTAAYREGRREPVVCRER